MKSLKFLIISTIILLTLQLLNVSSSLGCRSVVNPVPDTTAYIFNPDSVVASKLHTKRIVMLADFTHSASFSLNTPVRVLHQWLSSVEQQKLYDSRITLVLERSYDDLDIINKFIVGGNYDSLAANTGHAASLEDIEFYSHLRDFSQRIDSLNSRLGSRINFKVRGFETVGYFSDSAFGKLSTEQRDRWFINNRDTNTSVGLKKYIEENPKDEILIFYGGAHLMNGYMAKDGFTYTIRDGSKGYYLAHYLKSYFGDGNVMTINQVNKPTFLSSLTYNYLAKREAFVESGKLPVADTQKAVNDAVLLRFYERLCAPHDLRNFLCRKIADDILVNLNKLSGIDNIYLKRVLGNMFIHFYFGTHFTNLDEYEKWYRQNVNRISLDSMNYERIEKSVLAILFDNRQKAESFGSNYLQGFGIHPDQITIGDTLNWKSEVLPEIVKHIRFYNAVACYWFGYADEKIKGRDYLVEFSGQKFEEPRKYLEWYRHKYYGYDF